MSIRVTRSKSALSASSQASRLEALPDPLLHNILQLACANSDKADLANLLLSSKTFRSEILASFKGLVQLKYTTAKIASEAPAFAQWLGKHGQLASSLTFCSAVKWQPDEEEGGITVSKDTLAQLAVEAEHERALIEGAVAAGLQQAANNNSEAAGAGLHLQACSLCGAGPGIEAVLRQLPASCLTSLQLEILWPNSDDYPSTYLQPLRSSLVHLTNLKSLELAFIVTHPTFLHPDAHTDYHVDVNLVIKQVSSLTNLTSLVIPTPGPYWQDGDVLRHLPVSLQMLDLQWAGPRHDCPDLSLGHLTALTNLEGQAHVVICTGDHLPPNLLKLNVADIQDVQPLLPLTKLKSLRLHDAYFAAEPPLKKLSVLTALSHVEFGPARDPEQLKVIREALAGLPNLRHIV